MPCTSAPPRNLSPLCGFAPTYRLHLCILRSLRHFPLYLPATGPEYKSRTCTIPGIPGRVPFLPPFPAPLEHKLTSCYPYYYSHFSPLPLIPSSRIHIASTAPHPLTDYPVCTVASRPHVTELTTNPKSSTTLWKKTVSNSRL